MQAPIIGVIPRIPSEQVQFPRSTERSQIGIVQKVEQAVARTALEYSFSSLLRFKLDHQIRQIKPEESIEVLVECIQFGKMAAKVAENKDLVLFLGNTGSGKSTLVNYLLGCEMIRKDPKEVGLTGIEKIVVVKDPSQEMTKIGHGKESMTFLPELVKTHSDAWYCDCPGFFDNRGFEINSANAVNIKETLLRATSLKVVILLNYHSFKTDKAKGLKDLVQICKQLFGNEENLHRCVPSILLGITRIPVHCKDPISLADLKKFIGDTTDVADSFTQTTLQDLSSRLFVYDPLDELKEGAWNRHRINEEISKLPAIKCSQKIFKTVLTADDIQNLAKLCEELNKKLQNLFDQDQITEEDFIKAAHYEQTLNQLLLLEHQEVTKLVVHAKEIILDYFRGRIQQFHIYCTEETLAGWNKAQATLRKLIKGLSNFDDQVKQQVNNLLIQRPNPKNDSGTQLMQSHMFVHFKINQQLQDLLIGAHYKANELGGILKQNLDEFATGSGRLSNSLAELIQNFQNELRGALSANRLATVHSLFTLATRTLEVLSSSALQSHAFAKKGSEMAFKQFKEVIEIALYARKKEIEIVKEKLELVMEKEEHEWHTALMIHTQKLKEETARYNKVFEIQEMQKQNEHDETVRRLSQLDFKYHAIESDSQITAQEEEIYYKHQQALCAVQFEDLRATLRMDVEARCQIAELLLQISKNEVV